MGSLLRGRFPMLSEEQVDAAVRSLCSEARMREQWARYCDGADQERARNEAYEATALACIAEIREAVQLAMGAAEDEDSGAAGGGAAP